MANNIDDPFAPSDATILRPRPGRRPGAAPAGTPSFTPGGAPPPYQPAPAVPHLVQGAPPPAPVALSEFLSTGLNPLVQAAAPLLVLAGRLRGQIAQADVESLRRQSMQEVRAFEERARQAGVPSEDIMAARYALCTAVDEAVLNTPWGAQSGWSSQSLLVTFHREASGGEKFFQILERVSAEPQRYAALIELLYICLALGFEGRYRLDERGASRLHEIRQDLYRRIASMRGNVEGELSAHWKGVEDRRNAVMRFVPLWVVAAACAALLIGAFIFFNAKLSDRAAPVNAALANVGIEASLAAPALPDLPSSGIKAALADLQAAGRVLVEEDGASTLVTITVSDLFASGSARVSAQHEALVHRVGKAVAEVPGRVVVIGHTDDVPLRSFRFQDNYELSRARATQVTALLKADVADAARLSVVGRGDSAPRYTPANLPENRARNRRVEIKHIRDR